MASAIGTREASHNRLDVAVKNLSRRYWYDHRATAVWIICLLALAWRGYFVATRPAAAPEQIEEGVVEVRRVVDGDTLVLASGARVRLQGINCPESVKPDPPIEPWGPEASEFTADFIRSASHRVRLSFGAERKDQYDRFLAFVWNGDVLLNEELVRAGLAQAKLGYRYSGVMKSRLAKAQADARKTRRGIWSTPGMERVEIE
jgi:micrococcal nuclease